MTGFGRASVEAGDKRLRVEIRSVNHRGLDLKIRTREPDAFCDAEIGGGIARLTTLVGEIRAAAGGLPQRFARRLEDRLAVLRGQPGFEPGRVAQEAALMAERLDVSEELVRLETHLRHLDDLTRAA